MDRGKEAGLFEFLCVGHLLDAIDEFERHSSFF
jgi:hypothetical protein